jgi:hypothetical protein
LICLAMLAAEDVQEVVAAVVVVMVSGLGYMYCDLIRFCGEKTIDVMARPRGEAINKTITYTRGFLATPHTSPYHHLWDFASTMSRLLTGDECGLIKESLPKLGRPKHPIQPWTDTSSFSRHHYRNATHHNVQQKQARIRGVMDMCFTDHHSSSLEFAVLRADDTLCWFMKI